VLDRWLAIWRQQDSSVIECNDNSRGKDMKKRRETEKSLGGEDMKERCEIIMGKAIDLRLLDLRQISTLVLVTVLVIF